MIPQRYQNLYTELDVKLADFEACVFAHPIEGGPKTVFSAELLGANGNRGLNLLNPHVQESIYLELDCLQQLGLGAVSVAMNFPLLYQPFWDWTGEPHRFRQFVDFYDELEATIEARNMKLVVDNAVVFTGYYSENSGLAVGDYYETLDWDALVVGRSANATTILEELRPAYLNLGSEPDTQSEILGTEDLATPEGYSSFIRAVVERIPRNARKNTPLGAGVGSWKGDGTAFIDALAGVGIDYIDLHVYPVNFQCLMDQLEEFVDRAASHKLPAAIGEVWLLKQRNAECTISGTASNPTIFSRDAFSFWQPLDQKYLCSLVQFAKWKNLEYLSAFWSRYFWAYLEYSECLNMTPDQIITKSSMAAGAAIKEGATTGTGKAYQDAIGASPLEFVQGEK